MVLYGIALFALVALFIFLIFVVKASTQKIQNVEIKSAIAELTEEKKSHKMLGFESALVSKFSIPPTKIRWFLIAERLLLVSSAVILYIVFGVMGLVFVAAIAMAIIMNGKVQNEINKSGVSRIGETVAFMDYFVPQLAAGASSEDAFSKYMELLSPDNPLKPLLVEYYIARKSDDMNYSTPEEISDITSVFENAEYNEKLGSNNYLYIIEQAKADLFQKATYYQDFQTRIGEVIKPMKLSYYVIIPLIFLMLWSSVGDFWFTPLGWVVGVILLAIFFAFNFFCNKLTISTLRTILG